MKEQRLQVFVDIVRHYFKQLGVAELVVDTPYLLENKTPQIFDYTGVIGISGEKKGVVYFSASLTMLSGMLECMGETEKTNTNFVDLAGEVANTIAGNARKAFGPKFQISVPLVFKGAPEGISLPKDERSFIIPIDWQSGKGEIVICLQD